MKGKVRLVSLNRCFFKTNKKTIQEQKRIERGLILGFELIDKFLLNGGILSKYITRYTDVAFKTDNIILENCFYVFYSLCLNNPVLVSGILKIIDRYYDYLESLDVVYAQHLLKYGSPKAIKEFFPYLINHKDDSVIKLSIEYIIKYRKFSLDEKLINDLKDILDDEKTIYIMKGESYDKKR